MLLADLQMPSITGSEAVDKYIYIPERPPDNSIKLSQADIRNPLRYLLITE